MGPTIYLYVDGESHYVRSEKAVQAASGDGRGLNDLVAAYATPTPNTVTFRSDPRMTLHPKGKFFWDGACVSLAVQNRPFCILHRAVYVTSFAGDDEELYKLNVLIRDVGFDPCVVKEHSQLRSQRDNQLNQIGVIEKAKGVDIALATRMLEDAHRDNYSWCYLFTSDVDYLPVIEAVRRMGKRVCVFGSGDGLGKQSPLRYVPDQFYDIGQEFVKKCYPMVLKLS